MIKSTKFRFSAHPLSFRFWAVSSVALLLLFNLTHGDDYSSKDQLIESIHQRVRDLNSRMRAMGGSTVTDIETPYNSISNEQDKSYEKIGSESIPLNIKSKRAVSPEEIPPYEPNTGFYFLPFAGTASINDVEYLPPNLMISKVRSNVGYSIGARFGYRWKYFYLEERFSYMDAKLEHIEFVGNTPQPISGEISSLSLQQAFGLNFDFNHWIGIQFGVGAGISQQEFFVSLSPNSSMQEEDWVFSYDGIIGLTFQPVGYFRGGINYRWLRTEGLGGFSSTDMHLIELCIGIQF